MKNFLYQARRGTMVALALGCMVTLSGCAMLGLGAPANPLVGAWNCTSESALGTNVFVLTVADDLTGTVHADEGATAGTLPITDVTVEGTAATFGLVFDIQGTELAATFEGTIEGDNLTGQFVTDFGNAEITGTRVQ